MNPKFGDQSASLLIAGDSTAKQIVSELATAIGFEVADAGGLDAAILLENLARLWVHLARSTHGREIAFKVLMRSDGR